MVASSVLAKGAAKAVQRAASRAAWKGVPKVVPRAAWMDGCSAASRALMMVEHLADSKAPTLVYKMVAYWVAKKVVLTVCSMVGMMDALKAVRWAFARVDSWVAATVDPWASYSVGWKVH